MRRKNKPELKAKRIPRRFRPGAIDRYALKTLMVNQDEKDYEEFNDFDYQTLDIELDNSITK